MKCIWSVFVSYAISMVEFYYVQLLYNEKIKAVKSALEMFLTLALQMWMAAQGKNQSTHCYFLFFNYMFAQIQCMVHITGVSKITQYYRNPET